MAINFFIMKHILPLLCLLISIPIMSQTSKIVEPTQAGTLSGFFSEQEKSTITSLTLKGKVDARDFVFMRDQLKALTTLSNRLRWFQPDHTLLHPVQGFLATSPYLPPSLPWVMVVFMVATT